MVAPGALGPAAATNLMMPALEAYSAAAMRVYLAAEPSAIGYLPASEVDATCRTLLVLGR